MAAFCSSEQRSRLSGPQLGPKFSSTNDLRSSNERPPSYLSPIASVLPVKYLMVGYPRTPCFEQRPLPSAEVQSTSTITTLGLASYSSASWSQAGFSFLQWPHQGAKNLT